MTYSKKLASLALAFSISLPVVSAGCYTNSYVWMFNEDGSNFKFGHLHNNPYSYDSSDTTDVTQELSDAIDTVCSQVDGSSVGPGQHFDRCTEWPYEAQEDSCLLVDCPNDCNSNDSDCVSTCGDSCPWVETDVNNLVFEMKHDGNGDDTKMMTYDICSNAMHGIFTDCSDYGGDSTRDGFFFRLDPNPLACGNIADSAIIKLIGKGKAGKGKGNK